jgi:uncharacterized protein
MKAESKLGILEKVLRETGPAVVAYSGGIDSTFLAVVAKKVLAEGHLAVTASSPLRPDSETRAARALAKGLNLNQRTIKTGELKDKRFLLNPFDRCYYCKSRLWREMRRIAQTKGMAVIEGSTADDLKEYRPGKAAAMKYRIMSPLLAAGLTKGEIRALSRRMGLPNWDAPANSCLATRIPYGTVVTPRILKQIERSERVMHQLGFRQCRVRHHGELARIELLPKDIPAAARRSANIVKKIKGFGYRFVTLDLAGYQQGCYDNGKRDAKRKDN